MGVAEDSREEELAVDSILEKISVENSQQVCVWSVVSQVVMSLASGNLCQLLISICLITRCT